MRKGDNGETGKKMGKKLGKKRKKIMMKIVATNVVASRPPERRPTATPTARAKSLYCFNCLIFLIFDFLNFLISFDISSLIQPKKEVHSLPFVYIIFAS